MPDRLACAHCRQRPVEPRWRPFCSERCKMADLGRWLRGDYRIAAEPAAFDDLPEVADEPVADEPAGRDDY